LEQLAFPRTARAGAPSVPTRYLVLFGGMSIGRPNGPNHLAPGAHGPSYEVTDGLRPLETRGVRDRVAVVSNLVIPRSGGAVADAPGGMPLPWHATSMGPLLS